MKDRSMRRIIGKYFWFLPLAVAAVLLLRPSAKAIAESTMPAPAITEPAQNGPQTAVFAGGCFWGVQGVFEHVNGVIRAVSGYSGGAKDTAEYETVSTGKTGHAESVEVTYDPANVTYEQLLQIYFSVVADPTELNYQGPDHGTQYRSALFYQTPEQKRIADNYIAQLNQAGVFSIPIVTTTEKLQAFYPAEGYHQDFLTLNPRYPYIAVNDLPKVEALRRLFPGFYRADPVLAEVH